LVTPVSKEWITNDGKRNNILLRDCSEGGIDFVLVSICDNLRSLFPEVDAGLVMPNGLRISKAQDAAWCARRARRARLVVGEDDRIS
jgi:hypothetical protein